MKEVWGKRISMYWHLWEARPRAKHLHLYILKFWQPLHKADSSVPILQIKKQRSSNLRSCHYILALAKLRFSPTPKICILSRHCERMIWFRLITSCFIYWTDKCDEQFICTGELSQLIYFLWPIFRPQFHIFSFSVLTCIYIWTCVSMCVTVGVFITGFAGPVVGCPKTVRDALNLFLPLPFLPKATKVLRTCPHIRSCLRKLFSIVPPFPSPISFRVVF